MRNRRRVLRSLLVILTIAVCGVVIWSMEARNVNCSVEAFTESVSKLDNGDRGFYYIHGFRIDAEPVSREEMAERVYLQYWNDKETKLTLLEINIAAFRDGPITQAGLENLDLLFTELEEIDKHYILRFLYDWDGEIELYEPENLDTILTHMAQIGPVISKYSSRIYTMQGLFFGNWGEMNGSPFSEISCMDALAHALADATDSQIFLSVRMPAQWRRVTGVTDPAGAGNDRLAARLGLFNDGMMGSETDYGTYFFTSQAEAGPTGIWTRDEELTFQEKLCRKVPNGGEIIIDNPYNDFNNAVRDLARMHVSYLNLEYDRHVLDKWAAETIRDGSCYDGLDGLTYMDRHLGYRYMIDNAVLTRVPNTRWAIYEVNLANVGFAPIYTPVDLTMRVVDAAGEIAAETCCDADLRQLVGQYQPYQRVAARMTVDTRALMPGSYRVYLTATVAHTGETLAFANEQAPEEYGILVGKLVVDDE